MSIDNNKIQPIYNNNEIKYIVLSNVVKMLINRKNINQDDYDKTYKLLVDQDNDDLIYKLKINDNKHILLIKIINQKVNGFGKQTIQYEFLTKNKSDYKIIIANSFIDSAKKEIERNYINSEIFAEVDFMFSLLEYHDQPTFIWLDKNSDEYKTFFEQFLCNKKQIPKFNIEDPVVRYFGKKKWDIAKIIRVSETTGESISFRIVS